MPLYISSLNSGSNANCYYVGNAHEAVLVDAGLSCKETERRMSRLGLPMERVKAILVSHEHADHITGITALSRKYKLPVFITADTRAGAPIPLEDDYVRDFKHGKNFRIGNLTIQPFSKSHDAADPYSFVIAGEGVNIGVFTDLGYACKELIKHFKLCDAAFLESNYCENMLENGNYPEMLKKRIRGRKGHLSNDQALELFLTHRPKKLQHLILAHLSKNNNHPDLVHKLFTEKADGVKITVASRYEESPVFTIEATEVNLVPESKGQMSLF